MPDPTLFHGIAIVIDDEINDPGAGIRTIQTQIEAAGCHVLQMAKLPPDATVTNLRGVAFCVLDWNLYGRDISDLAEGANVPPTAEIKRQNAEAAIEFLKKLKKVCVAPVFIFTNESTEEVEALLKEHPELFDEKDPSHILVRRKADVTAAGVFPVLNEWLERAPSVYVLKKWERVYEKAKNELFQDFYNNSVHWPMVLWKSYEQDEIDGSLELGNLIGRNLLSRMTPFHFDLAPYQAAFEALDDTARSGTVVMKVLEGERFLQKDRLEADSISPGDVFKKSGSYLINIRPDCDCIARGGVTQDEIEIYLLKGSKVTENQLKGKANQKYGTISEADTETIIFGMFNGATLSFQFKDLVIGRWKDWKEKRIGRLLPPFLTRLQQRYAAYLQRPGLTRIPAALLPIPSEQVVEAQAAVNTQAASGITEDPTGPPVPPAATPTEASADVKPAADAQVVEAQKPDTPPEEPASTEGQKT